MKKITIAIDGFSSTGKSTIAKKLANILGYIYVDSGAMYRAVTYYAMQSGYITTNHFDKEALVDSLSKIHIAFQFNKALGFAEVYLNGINIENEIRTIEVSNFVSTVAAVQEVRSTLVKIQKELGKYKGVIMDGRDIGTVVFPNAELKIFMTASAQTRAQRRFNEMQSRNEQVSFEDVLENVQKRDYLDSTREESPLIKAEDAIEIDNSDLTIEEQIDFILKQVSELTIQN